MVRPAPAIAIGVAAPARPAVGYADRPSRPEILRRPRQAQANGAPAGAPSPGTSGRVTKRAPSVAGPSAPAWASLLMPSAWAVRASARLPRLVARGCPVAMPGRFVRDTFLRR